VIASRDQAPEKTWPSSSVQTTGHPADALVIRIEDRAARLAAIRCGRRTIPGNKRAAAQCATAMLCVEVSAVQPMVGLACVLQLASGAVGSAPMVGVTDWVMTLPFISHSAIAPLSLRHRMSELLSPLKSPISAKSTLIQIAHGQNDGIGRRRNNPVAAGLFAWDQARDMTNDNTISIGWLLAGVLAVSIVFNGIALALA
jgi:hypothetical protein